MNMVLAPTCVADVRSAVRGHASLCIRGNGTKPPLAQPESSDPLLLTMNRLAGVIDYDPDEFTFTALAGTRLEDIDALLAQHNQYLPFDPPLMKRGATLGGTVAAGLSGPGRLRYGGVRDFILAVRMVDGLATNVRGGAKVVKNAAGFDLPKLMVGSLGRLGVLVEITMKVFPRPSSFCTIEIECRSLDDAIQLTGQLASQPWDLHALDLLPPTSLLLRLGGDASALRSRAERLRQGLDRPCEILDEAEDIGHWIAASEFAWPTPGSSLVKVPTTLATLAQLDRSLAEAEIQRRYSVAGNVAWVAWPTEKPLGQLDEILMQQNLDGLVVLGTSNRCRIGAIAGQAMTSRVKKALDPDNRFGPH
jgi:glycolate oxidase FAD binding subunit